MDDLSGLRWLAREVEPEIESASPRLPPPLLVSEQLRRREVREYVSWWIAHPNPTGTFATKTRWLRRLPASLLPRILLALRYDGIIYLEDSRIVGHVFFQRRGAALHCFSVGVADALSGRGYATVMQLDFVALAAMLPGMDGVRIGRRGSPVPRRALHAIHQHEERLGWRVTEDGWVLFTVNVRADGASNREHE